jgi:DNA-binding NarL/FixJ family response regulator
VSGNDVFEEARIAMSKNLQMGKSAAIVLVEYSPSLLLEREEVLKELGHPVICALGSNAARYLDLTHDRVGVVTIGHGTSAQERCELISYFRGLLPEIPIVVLLRRSDPTFERADFNCPADNPPLWVRTVTQALAGIT